jgi:putative ABC transport system permease protein
MAWFQKFRNIFRPGRLQRDLERELAFHVREREEELQESGLSHAEAARAARQQFGNFTSQLERTRDMDIHEWLESMVRNLRYGVRVLAKTPAFTITVILTLALGIGANSAVFSAIYAVLLRPLPFPNDDELVKLLQSRPNNSVHYVAPIRIEEWNRFNSTFQAITGYSWEDASETSGDIPEKLRIARVAPRFLQVLGITPALGRDFNPQEERYGGPAVVLISYRLWQHRFGGDANAIGKVLRFAGQASPIIGIMAASFQFPDRDVDVWSLRPPDAPYAQNRELGWYTGIGRLKRGVTVAQARDNLAAVQSGLGRQYPKPDATISASITPLKEATVGGVRKSLWLLFASVSLLLLIVCTNIAALLLSRAAARRQETAVRFSLGASRVSVAAQLFTEVLILAVAGALAGLILAAGASYVFRALAKDLPRIEEIGLHGAIVVYSLVCAVAVTLLSGIVPAIRGTRGSLAALANGGRSQVSGRNPLQFLLVGMQVALAVILLEGAGLLVRSFQELGRVSPGFDPQHVLTFRVSSTFAEAGGNPATQRTKRILDSLRSMPGIEGAATARSLPGVPDEYEIELKTTEGHAETEPGVSETKMLSQGRWVAPEYFSVLHIPILDGELCRDEPNVPAVMVNRSFANRYLNGAAAIGRRLVQPANPHSGPAVIRGIVGDVRETGLDREPPPTAYWCASAMQPFTVFLIRARGEPGLLAGTVRRKINEVEPLRSVYDVTPLTSHISDAYAENRLRMVLLAFFALTAIALASVGIYGTLSYAVNVRRREVAVRMALGALRAQVARQFLAQGLAITMLGCMAGLAFAIAFVRTLSSMLYGVSATDAITLGGVAVIMLAVSVLASLFPAIRAARLEPMQALREG